MHWHSAAIERLHAQHIKMKSPKPLIGLKGIDPFWAKLFTGLSHEETPFIHAHVLTDAYGSGKHGTHGAVRMYFLVHLTIAVAIGLMGAASGRGLAVWVMSVRLPLASLGATNIPGQDYLLSLVSIDGCSYFDTMPAGSHRLAGEARSGSLPGWVLILTAMMPILETLIISARRFYGALNSLRLTPPGVVGNGMLGLSTLTAMALSIRALLGVKQRYRRGPSSQRFIAGISTFLDCVQIHHDKDLSA
jgi:hypothetical protein